MANRFQVAKTQITAGQQFLGTEFAAVQSSAGKDFLHVQEIRIHMGPEAKSWKVSVKGSDGISYVVRASNGAAATDTDVFLSGADFDITLLPGDSIAVVTTGLTAQANAMLIVEERPNDITRTQNSPQFTR